LIYLKLLLLFIADKIYIPFLDPLSPHAKTYVTSVGFIAYHIDMRFWLRKLLNLKPKSTILSTHEIVGSNNSRPSDRPLNKIIRVRYFVTYVHLPEC